MIFTASLLSFQGGVLVPSYAAAKSGVSGLVKALANEWAPHGVNVNAIAPGYIATDNTQALRDDPDRTRAILERIPAGRWGVPGDLAGATVFLASPGFGLRVRDDHRGRRRMAGPLSDPDVLRLVCAGGVIPVVVAEDADHVRPLASALKRGGLPVAEVTLRTDASVRALRILAQDRELLVGAGTVIRPEQVDLARDAGAQFVVTPGFSARVVERCRELAMPVIPGRLDRDRGNRGA